MKGQKMVKVNRLQRIDQRKLEDFVKDNWPMIIKSKWSWDQTAEYCTSKLGFLVKSTNVMAAGKIFGYVLERQSKNPKHIASKRLIIDLCQTVCLICEREHITVPESIVGFLNRVSLIGENND